MADEIPITEIRHVVIQYEIAAPMGAPLPVTAQPEPQMDMDEIVEHVRRELIRKGYRNPDIFGGRA